MGIFYKQLWVVGFRRWEKGPVLLFQIYVCVCPKFSCLGALVWTHDCLRDDKRILGLFKGEALLIVRSGHPGVASAPPAQRRSHQQHNEKHWEVHKSKVRFPLLNTERHIN